MYCSAISTWVSLTGLVDVEDIVVDDFFADVQVLDIALDTAFEVKAVALAGGFVFK